MLGKIKNILYILSFIALIFLITLFYFSDQNIQKTNKYRSYYLVKIKENIENLPLLKNDTNNIIEYKDDLEVYKKSKKKYTFWDLIKK
tara:strand:- start:285 stop:548 length:264 start_codon:yes stop_codon:yes gene_type:complete